MSLFGSMMLGLEDDPIFGGTRRMMTQMDQLMSSMMGEPFEDPFFSRVGPRPMSRSLFPTLGGIPNMMTMDQMTGQGNCHAYTSSSVMTMMTGPDGAPQVYQETASTRSVPGGVRETKKTVTDSRNNMKRMAIGHHIGDRAHIVERHQRGGELEEHQELINVDENEACDFDAEFRRRTQHGSRPAVDYRAPRSHAGGATSHLPALPSTSYRRRARPMLAITSGSSGDERPKRHERTGRSRRYSPVQ